MRLNEIFRLVLINIQQNKFKVFLTSLGIIVGTITIVMVIAIGEGGKQDVAEQFKTLNAGTITVTTSSTSIFSMMPGGNNGGGMPFDMPSGMPAGGGTSGGGGSRSSGGGGTSRMPGGTSAATIDTGALDEEDLEDILFFVPNITAGAISATEDLSVYGGDLEEETEYTIVGTESSYQSISNLTLLFGSFITDTDSETQTRAVVLGYDIAAEMFTSITDAYDAKIDIDGRTYVVNGVLASVGSVVSGIAPDTSIFMPYTTADKYILGRDTMPQFTFLASDVDEVPTIMENIELVLTQSNPDGMFAISDAGATMEAAMQSANTLSLLLMAVAVIVFIVGGIGIMNVLFVSVKERTREIGVLKAIGTKKWDILLLFLLEASMMGLLGGAIGVLLSFGIMPLMEYTDITVVMTMEAVVLAFGFAVFTGTVFGFYPALQASQLVPIDALNNE